MKYLLADVYRMLHQWIKNRKLATFVGILYISFLTFIILHAIVVLLGGMVPAATEKVFINKYLSLAVFAVIIGLLYWSMPSPYLMKKEKERSIRYGMIVIYTFCAIFSFVYLKYLANLAF